MSVNTLRQFRDPQICRTVVLKIGSSLLVDVAGEVRESWLRALASEIAEMRAAGQRVVIVTSGAIALGAARIGLERGAIDTLADAQAAASVGQIALAGLWSKLLEQYGLGAAQLLLTLDDLEDRARYLNASATLARLLDIGIVPVVNENDSVATAEIRFGDNDRLAARVAQAAGADGVILLSDVDGLMDRNPDHSDAKLIPLVEGTTSAQFALANGGSGSGLGSGGMRSKLQAAQIAERAGIALAVINGTHDRPVSKTIDYNRGTVFSPTRSDNARKSWLGGRMASVGSITVDSGCEKALADGASLLAAGIVDVVGSFERGDLVTIVRDDGTNIAQGLTEYDADDCRKIMGYQQAEQPAILGHAPRSAAIHRNHLVIL